MSYTIKNTGGVLNIGQLMDFDGEIVDIATNKAAIQATWKDDDGNNIALITITEGGDDYTCKLTVAPGYTVSGTTTPSVAGAFYPAGTHNTATYYTLEGWILYRYNDGGVWRWAISSTLDDVSGVAWLNGAVDTLVGTYSPNENAEGNAIIAVSTLPLGGSQTIRLSSTTDAIVPRNIVVDVLTEAAYNNLYSGTDTQALIAAVAVVDGNVDEIETDVTSVITGLNVLGSRSLNDLYGSNNVLIP